MEFEMNENTKKSFFSVLCFLDNIATLKLEEHKNVTYGKETWAGVSLLM